jgi:hypothetical protein
MKTPTNPKADSASGRLSVRDIGHKTPSDTHVIEMLSQLTPATVERVCFDAVLGYESPSWTSLAVSLCWGCPFSNASFAT